MDGVEGKHTKYADDVNIWSSHRSLAVASEKTNSDLNSSLKPWCRKWTTSVAADKTDVLVVTPDGKEPNSMMDISLGDEKLKVVKLVGWLVVLRLNVPVNNFSVMSGRSHRFLGN